MLKRSPRKRAFFMAVGERACVESTRWVSVEEEVRRGWHVVCRVDTDAAVRLRLRLITESKLTFGMCRLDTSDTDLAMCLTAGVGRTVHRGVRADECIHRGKGFLIDSVSRLSVSLWLR
jgi:hypothetical protein